MDRERALVSALRSELASIDPARRCCRTAERAGLGPSATGQARSIGVARLAVRLEAAEPDVAGSTFDWEDAAEHCRMAWLRGLFLGSGSLSLSGGRTHLEFVVSEEEAPVLAKRVTSSGLPASWRVRRRRGVVTWKSGEVVLAFLRRAGATAAAMELETRSVEASLHGQLNRIINAESANLSRSVASSAQQLAAITALEASGTLKRLPAFPRNVARLRQEAPEATYSDLARRAEASRPRVQRALRLIEVLADRERPSASVG